MTILISLLSSISQTFIKIDHIQEDALDFMEIITKFIYSEESAISK